MKKIVYAEKNLESLAHELDSELGGINCRLITLNDVKTLVAHLREDMDNVDPENLQVVFNEFHRNVRILDELTKYTVDDLQNDYNNVQGIKDAIFDKVVQREVKQ